MSKRELKISDKELYSDTKEEMIFRSPLKIPIKGLQELINLKGVKPTHYAYYDISQTENQNIDHITDIEQKHHNIVGYTDEEGIIKMGKLENI